MPAIAYIANQFPSPVEPYVMDEIHALRARGMRVIPTSVWRPGDNLDPGAQLLAVETLYLRAFRYRWAVAALWMCLKNFTSLKDLWKRLLFSGNEPLNQRIHAIAHTWLGAYYAQSLAGEKVTHIHAHHGYFSSWIAMVAARLMGIGFSMTLHGSDLLLDPVYLDVKLQNCKFCMTVSEYNRRHILQTYRQIDPDNVILRRLGVNIARTTPETSAYTKQPSILLSVGRLHPVKDHAFLLRACRQLQNKGLPILVLIAGEGPERISLEQQIRELCLEDQVKLLGHISQQKLASYYAACDLVVLTSRSEGIPLVLMEAMSHGKPVLAPAMTGIPELVLNGKTGFLYRAGSLEDFMTQVETVCKLQPALGPLRRAARLHVREHFNQDRNLSTFCDLFIEKISGVPERKYA